MCIMLMIDKPVTKLHSFFIIHGFNFGNSSNFVQNIMKQFSYCPCTAYRNTTLVCQLPQRFSSRIFRSMTDIINCFLRTQLLFNSHLSVKILWVKTSSLIWKLDFQMEMDRLFMEIYGKIFSCLIHMSFFSHNHK
jgi:hypothetical protein